MILLDTSFLIDFLKDDPEAVKTLENMMRDGPFVTSTINVHEFLTGGYGSKKSPNEVTKRKKLLSKLIIISFDENSANESAIIEGNLNQIGLKIGSDALIVGCMIANDIRNVLTRNIKHFTNIPEITVISY